MSGNTFKLYTNGSWLTNVTNPNNTINPTDTYYLALFASPDSASTEVGFSKIKVYQQN